MIEEAKAEPVDPMEFESHNSLNIAGINKNGVTIKDVGTWKGWVYRHKANPYDKNAVAVFKGKKHIGYLSRQMASKYAHDVESLGGQVPAFVQIEQLVDDDGRKYFVGRVEILWESTESHS